MSYKPANPNGQATMANSEPVVIASDQTAIPVSDGGGSITIDGTVTANAGTNLNTSLLALESGGNLAAAAASLAVIDDWDESDRAKTNPIVGQAGVAAGAGVATVATQRVVIVTDQSVIPINDNGGSITVDGSVTANAGTNLNTSALALEAGGNLAAVATSTAILDDWDESDRAKVNPIAGQAGVAAGAGVTDALTQRVILATDQAALPVTDNGGSLTVDGTVTANAGTNLNTSLLALEAGGNLAAIAASASVLDDWDETDRAKVNTIVGVAGVTGGSGVVTTGTQRVVLATDVALPTGSNTIGSIASITTSMVPGTGANNLGKAEDAVHASGDTGVFILAVRADTAAATGANGDYVGLISDSTGRLYTNIASSPSAIAKTEDAVAASADVGVFALSVRRDSLNAASPTSAAGDYQQLSTDNEGVQWTRNVAVYNATPPTVTDTNKTDLQTDVNANLKIVEGAVEVSSYFQALLSDVDISVKASAGYFKSVVVTNMNAAVRYFQVHNKATAPAGGDTALLSIPIPAGSSTVPSYLILDTSFFGDGGLACSTGVAVGISTAATTFTAATTTDHTVAGTYV